MSITGSEAAALYEKLRRERSMTHDYTSTACHHNVHDRCRLTCKFCQVRCQCRCHSEGSP